MVKSIGGVSKGIEREVGVEIVEEEVLYTITHHVVQLQSAHDFLHHSYPAIQTA